jgi:hypothetical protein
MCMSVEQKRKMEEARRESEEKTYGVNATGMKSSLKEFDNFSNQIDNE